MLKNKRFILLAGFFIFFQIVFGAVLEKLDGVSGTKQILDLYFHYSPQLALDLLQQYGSEGRQWYLFILGLDLIYPIVYALLLQNILRSLFKRRTFLSYFQWLPFMAAAFDYFENVLELKMVFDFPQAVLSTAVVSAWITSAKWAVVLLILIVIILQVVLNMLVPIKSRMRRGFGI